MTNYKQRHLFPGGNTSKGFYSFYRYILSQEDANRIICIKGGPGTGKSSFMKKIGKHFGEMGYSIEYHHCSSDNNSLDGVVIKELKVALLDGTSPHIVDPINPGAVDEILNVGVALDSTFLAKNKKEIIKINKEIGKSFKRAYRFLGSAKSIHEDWSILNSESLKPLAVPELIDTIFASLPIDSSKLGYGNDRHIFSTAFTPDGIVSFNEDLSKEAENLIVIKGGPGLGKSELLRKIGSRLQKSGYFVEYLHDPFIPERIENILVPEASIGIFTTNEISNINYPSVTYNMYDLCSKSALTDRVDEVLYDQKQFDSLVSKGLSCIKNSKALHDQLESYYIQAMDFSVVDIFYNETVKKIESYI